MCTWQHSKEGQSVSHWYTDLFKYCKLGLDLWDFDFC